MQNRDASKVVNGPKVYHKRSIALYLGEDNAKGHLIGEQPLGVSQVCLLGADTTVYEQVHHG